MNKLKFNSLKGVKINNTIARILQKIKSNKKTIKLTFAITSPYKRKKTTRLSPGGCQWCQWCF